MRKIKIEKITLNIGAGKDEDELKRGLKLLRKITGAEAVKTITNKRLPAWGLRPGLAIGCKFTIRGKEAEKLLKRLLEAKDNKMLSRQFDMYGNFSFGIPEYIDIPGVDYDPEIKIMGLEVAVTLQRAGYRIAKRRVQRRRVPSKHRIKPKEAVDFMKDRFGVTMAEVEE